MSTPAQTGDSLIVVSNRLPVTLERKHQTLERRPSSGGLVSALSPVLEKSGGIWIGWPGLPLRAGEELSSPEDPYRMIPLDLSTSEINRYYHGFSNATLWPLFHCFPERSKLERRDWEVYDQVNQRFAAVTAEHSGSDELILVQDYQLLRMPLHLRKNRPDARIAFFNHIPFPPYDVYRLLPWSRELLLGMTACDVIGFHIPGYAENFLSCAERVLGARVDRDTGVVEYGDRTVQVGAHPIGIDFERFAEAARSAPASEEARERIVLGVDRLDYTKGIPERIRAFERLLELHPEHREKVVLLQVAVPSRIQVQEYGALKAEIDELVGRVNGNFATSRWSPIRYLYRSVPQARLAALYRDADVGLVTPLRDGMNLVAKEFVAAQVAAPGVLVLSRLAGAAETMFEALQVNPYSTDSVAEALHRALTMEREEREERMQALRRREREKNVDHWLATFLQSARDAHAELTPVSGQEFERWLARFLDGYRLALFLDYDGTLTPLRDHPSEATLPGAMQRALESCSARADTDVSIVSGRALDDIREAVPVPGVVFAGNHGLEISGGDIPDFRHPDLRHYREGLDTLAGELQEIAPAGAWVEEKGASLTLHFRQAPPNSHAGLVEQARPLIQQAGFQARDASYAVEARPPIGWDKGHAVLHVLRARYGPAWSSSVRPIYVGDDDTDEDAFRVLSGLGWTFRVGTAERPSLARRQLPRIDSVQAMLEWLGRRR